VIAALVAMRPAELHLTKRAVRGPRQLREGLAYVWRTPELRIPLVAMAVLGTLTYNFHVTLPLLAKFTFEGGPLAYGILSAVMGLGAVIGGLASARRAAATTASMLRAAGMFGASMLLTAAAPTLPLAVASLLFVGAASIRFIATANAALQLGAAPEMRGRVMALWGVAFLGTTPIGGPIVGWIGQVYGARSAIVVGAVAAIGAAAAGYRALRRSTAGVPAHAQTELRPADGVALAQSKRWRQVAPAGAGKASAPARTRRRAARVRAGLRGATHRG
jgi:MFS family permease